MKLLRYGPVGEEKPGLLDADGAIRSLEGHVDDLSSETLSRDSFARLAEIDPLSLPLVEGEPRIGPCVADVGKILCIGKNYADHAAETGGSVPGEPLLFMKATSSLVGPLDDLVIPRGSTKTDWEVELGVVIGDTAKHVTKADALEHVAGFCVAEDVSEREYQIERFGQFTKGKSCDTFASIGPWLVTKDEVADPQALGLWQDVDGVRCQGASTASMIFGVAHLVSYLSDFMTLHPGDLIFTGTPSGVAMGMDPPAYLRPGQELRMGVEGLGEQRRRVVAYDV